MRADVRRILFTFGSLLACGSAMASPVTINASASGWYADSGFHTSNNPNYAVGFDGASLYNDFFTFDLSSLSGPISSATLRLSTFLVSSAFPSETVSFFDVFTSIPVLTADQVRPDIYSDLGSGTLFGSRTYFPADSFQVRDVALNAAAIAAINAAAGGGFAIGGSIVTLNGQGVEEFVFGNSGQFVQQLIVEAEAVPVPEPSSLFLLGTGLLAGVRRWRRRQQTA